MANKTFNTRVKNKRDTAANWEAVATTFQPLDGELIIVDTSAGKTRFKVGRYDTAKGRLLYYNEIPFADEYLYNDLNESQGKIYDTIKGVDDKSIIEMTLEPTSGDTSTMVIRYDLGLWQLSKSGYYKIKIPQYGTFGAVMGLSARQTAEDGTTPEDFAQSNIIYQSLLAGDNKSDYIFALSDVIEDDTQLVYKVQFFNIWSFAGIILANVYTKADQKWAFGKRYTVYANSATGANKVYNALTLTKGDTTTTFNGSSAQTVEIPTKTSELTNDSNFTTQTDLDNIADTYATIAMLQSLLPKVTTITLTSNWVGDASPYYQDIALSCVTETSIVDLQPTPEQLNSWQDDGIAFTTLSGNGTVRVYVAGGKPSSAISVQVRVQEVTVI